MTPRLALLGLLCCATPMAAAGEVFFDDFNDDYLDPCNWLAASGEGVTITEAGGRLTLTSELGAEALVSTVYAFQGNFDVQVDYDLLQFPLVYACNATLIVRSTDPGFNLVSIKRWRDATQNVYAFIKYVNGNYEELAVEPTQDGSGKFRIERVGSQFTAYRWSGTWAEIGSTDHFSGPARVNLHALGAGSRPTVEVAYDNCSVDADGMTADGDTDFDGDVDRSDFAGFSACMSGPEDPAGPDCALADFDCDTDVDLGDFALFQQAFTGPQP